MKKSKALELLGGSVAEAALAVGVTPSAVSQWPDELPSRLSDRVLAALARKHLPPELIGTAELSEPEPGRDSADHGTLVSADTLRRAAVVHIRQIKREHEADPAGTAATEPLGVGDAA